MENDPYKNITTGSIIMMFFIFTGRYLCLLFHGVIHQQSDVILALLSSLVVLVAFRCIANAHRIVQSVQSDIYFVSDAVLGYNFKKYCLFFSSKRSMA
jgi:hypothetical protein